MGGSDFFLKSFHKRKKTIKKDPTIGKLCPLCLVRKSIGDTGGTQPPAGLLTPRISIGMSPRNRDNAGQGVRPCYTFCCLNRFDHNPRLIYNVYV